MNTSSNHSMNRSGRHGFTLCVMLLGVLCLPTLVFGQDRIHVNNPMVYPPSAQASSDLNRILTTAAEQMNLRFGAVISMTYQGSTVPGLRNAAGSPAYSVDIIANNIEGGRVLVFTMRRNRDQATSTPANLFGVWNDDMVSEIVQSLRHLRQSFIGFDAFPLAEPPQYLDELNGRMISTVDLGFSMPLTPTSVAVKPNGNLIVGASVLAVELDRFYREVGKPGIELFTGDQISYAYDVKVTEAGTIFARTASGGDVYIIRPEFTRHQRLQTGIDTPAGSAALSDGSYVVVDATSRRAIRLVGRESQDLPIYSNDYSYVNVFAAGPDTTLWTWDPLTGGLYIYTALGERIDVVVPYLPAEDRGSVRAIQPLPRGGFILMTMNALFRFDRTGVPVWKLDGLPPPLSGNYTMIQSMTVDAQNGYIYLLSAANQRLIRLIDPSLAEGGISDFDRRILEINQRIAADRNNPAALIQLAELYDSQNALNLAADAWRRVADIDPFDMNIAESLDRADGLVLAERARQGGSRTRDIVATVGIESARQQYSVSLQLFEQAAAKLSVSPAEAARVRTDANELRSFFENAAAPRSVPRPPQIRFEGFTDLFPALIQTYLDHPAGTLVVENLQTLPMTNLKATVSLRYSDFPTESSPISDLAPGVSARIPLMVVLSPDVLTLQEDTPVLIRVELTYDIDGQTESALTTRTVTMRRNTALLWDDSAKLASFVTANDSVVSRFALDVVRAGGRTPNGLLSEKTFRAARIADALGTFGIQYIEDPASPFTSVSETAEILDTVRFPRTTLRVGAGDCDDTTALLASLFEAAAIHTAILTSPGHVFLAFDTEEPAANQWLYEGSGRRVIVHGGTLWIPIETTILNRGFPAAWQEGSRLVSAYADEIEFIPVSDSRNLYPAIPLAEASFEILPPPASSIDPLASATGAWLDMQFYRSGLTDLNRQIPSGRTAADLRTAARVHNLIGVLHARFGDGTAAELSFRSAISSDASNTSARINLANLLLQRGEFRQAGTEAGAVLQTRPRSVAALVIAVQAAAGTGDAAGVQSHLESLRIVDSTLADRFAGLLAPADGTARASDAAREPVVIWDRE